MKLPKHIAIYACVAILALLSTSQAFAIVGYVNMTYPAGWSMVANPLQATDNTLNALFNLNGNNTTTIPAGSDLFTWSGSTFSQYSYLSGNWVDIHGHPAGTASLFPGQGALFYAPTAPTNAITFVGVVLGIDGSGNRLPATPPPSGIYLLSSVAPTGPSGFQAIIGRAPQAGDAVMLIDTAEHSQIYDFLGGQWSDPHGGTNAPAVGLGQSALFDLTGGNFSNFALPVPVAVPEPVSALLLGLGCPVLFAFRRRKA